MQETRLNHMLMMEVLFLGSIILLDWIHPLFEIRNTIVTIYLLCYLTFQTMLIRIRSRRFSLFPSTQNRAMMSVLLLISCVCSTFYGQYQGWLVHLNDFLFVTARYSLISEKPSSKSKIHNLSFAMFILEQSIHWISNEMINHDLSTLCFLLFAKYSIDILIIYKIMMQSLRWRAQSIKNYNN